MITFLSMHVFYQKLRRPWVITIAFTMFALLGYSFSYFQDIMGVGLLDVLINSQEARLQIANMDGHARTVHFWMTLIVDSAYPLLYFCWMAGVIALLLHYLSWGSKSWGFLFYLGLFLGLGSDFAENIIQLCALKGVDFLVAKPFFTSLKFGFLLVNTVLVLGLFGVCLHKRLHSS